MACELIETVSAKVLGNPVVTEHSFCLMSGIDSFDPAKSLEGLTEDLPRSLSLKLSV